MISPSLAGLMLGQLAGAVLSLHTADPLPGALYELSGGSYARQPFEITPEADGTHVNLERVSFLNLPGGEIAALGLWLGGELIFSSTLTEVVALRAGDGLDLPPRSLRFDLTQLPA